MPLYPLNLRLPCTPPRLGKDVQNWIQAGRNPLAYWLGREQEFLRARQMEVFLVGGSVRDVALGREPRDLDLIISPRDWANLQVRWAGLILRPNMMGGVKLDLPDGWTADVWSFPVPEGAPRDAFRDRVARHLTEVCFSLETVAVEVSPGNPGTILDDGFCDAINARRIDLIATPYIRNRELTAARACMFAYKYPDFRSGRRLREWVGDAVSDVGLEQIYEQSMRHYFDESPRELRMKLETGYERLVADTPVRPSVLAGVWSFGEKIGRGLRGLVVESAPRPASLFVAQIPASPAFLYSLAPVCLAMTLMEAMAAHVSKEALPVAALFSLMLYFFWADLKNRSRDVTRAVALSEAAPLPVLLVAGGGFSWGLGFDPLICVPATVALFRGLAYSLRPARVVGA